MSNQRNNLLEIGYPKTSRIKTEYNPETLKTVNDKSDNASYNI